MLKLESNADAISIKILLQPKNLILFFVCSSLFFQLRQRIKDKAQEKDKDKKPKIKTKPQASQDKEKTKTKKKAKTKPQASQGYYTPRWNSKKNNNIEH